MKFSSENHSGDVNIDSGPGGFLHPFQPGIHIHIASESIFTSLRNDYSHAPESALKPGGILSSVGVYSGHLRIQAEAFYAGLADQTIVTTLCPGGKARMQRLMRLVKTGRIDLTRLLTHVFPLDEIDKAYELFASRREQVLKVAIRVS